MWPIPVIGGPRRLGWEPRPAGERLAKTSRKMEA
jgi:hypothetical protein